MIESAILIIVGLFVGVVSSFFGIGGGIIAIPALYTLYPILEAQTIIGTSLGMIFCNGLLNIYNLKKYGLKSDIRFTLFAAFFMMVGVIVATRTAHSLSKEQLKLIFAIFLLTVAIKVSIVKSIAHDQNWKPLVSLRAAFAPLIAGVISGLTGLGGGSVLIPLFITLLKMPHRWIPVYSNPLMVFGTGTALVSNLFATSSPSIFPKFQVGHTNFALILFLFVGSFLGSKIGSKLIHKIDEKRAKWAFVALLLTISLKIFLSL